MPQSLSQVIIHLIFSTKDRAPAIGAETLKPLHGYLASTARNAGCHCYKVGGVSDHVHLALGMPRTETISKLVEGLKTSSSKWMKFESNLHEFAWQRGYGVFSVGHRDLGSLIAYIEAQPEHHQKMTFRDEYLKLLREFGVQFDERYLWD